MRGSSAQSLVQVREGLDQALAGGANAGEVGNDLLTAAGVLRDQVSLRRAATDPSAAVAAKSALLATVFRPHLGAAGLGLVASAGEQRWAASSDLLTALEQLGVVAIVKGADQAGDGDRLEAELFSFGRAVIDNPPLRDALSDPSRSVADKQGLVRGLLEGKATPATIRLAEEAVTGNHQTVSRALDVFTKAAAAARNRTVATVRVARPLTSEQAQRLARALANGSGTEVHLNQVVDTSIVGGIRVEIGDDVVDGTISSRVDGARRLIAG